MRVVTRLSLCTVLAFLLLPAIQVTVQAQAPATPAAPAAPAADNLTKPLTQFTVGDVFPKVAGDAFRQTGKDWQAAADEFNKRAGERRAALSAAIPAKETEIKNLKTQLKAANKDKDFTKAGTLEGQIKTEEIVTAVLQQLTKLNESQSATATAWSEVGSAMQKFVDADEKFDQFRSIGIARKQDGATSERLSAEGYNALVNHSQALADLADAFGKISSDLGGLASRRKALLDSLAKGGHVEKP